MRVLIVDDNQGMRLLIRRSFSDAPAEFVECAGGAQAVEECSTTRPDLILMDIMMPDVDGLEATRCITRMFPGVRIVILTDYDDPGLRSEAQRAGASDYFLKEDLSALRALLLRDIS